MRSYLSEITNRQPLLTVIVLAGAIIVGWLISYFAPLQIIAGLIGLLIVIFIFKQPAIGLLLIAFFLPFERVGSYDWGSMTIRVSQILLIVTLAAWLVRQILDKKIVFVRNPVFWPLIIFLLINLVSLTQAENPERSSLVLIFIGFTALASLLVPNLLTSEKRLRRLVTIILVSATLVSLFGLYQFFGDFLGLPTTLTGLRTLYTKDILGFPRIQSTALEPLYFANYLLIPIALALVLFLSRESKIKNLWLIALIALTIVNLVLTVSRGGYLALAGALIVIAVFYLKKLLTIKKITILLAVLVLVWLVVTRALGFQGEALNLETFKNHVSNVFYGASYQERVETLTQANLAFLKNPLIGIGVGGFGPFMAAHPYYQPTDGWPIVNNEFVEILAETGLLGLLSFIIILLVLFFRSLKAVQQCQNQYLKAIMIALLAAFIGIIIQYQTFSTLYVLHIWFLFGLMIAVQNLILIKNKND